MGRVSLDSGSQVGFILNGFCLGWVNLGSGLLGLGYIANFLGHVSKLEVKKKKDGGSVF